VSRQEHTDRTQDNGLCTWHLLDSSLTPWTVHLLHTSPTVTIRTAVELFLQLPYLHWSRYSYCACI